MKSPLGATLPSEADLAGEILSPCLARCGRSRLAGCGIPDFGVTVRLGPEEFPSAGDRLIFGVECLHGAALFAQLVRHGGCSSVIYRPRTRGSCLRVPAIHLNSDSRAPA